MLIKENKFDSLTEFIEHLKNNEKIVGIVEYGGRTHTDMSNGGDYDLTIIFDKPVSPYFNGVHFHIKGIPVDCMILSVEDFMTETPLNEFLLVHLNCKILYDKNNIISELLNRIQITWAPAKMLSDFEIALYRFTFRHILDKLKNRLNDNELYTKYFIYASMDWYLSCYARIKCWERGRPKLHLRLIEEQEPLLFGIISKLYNENPLEVKFDLLSKCADYMLEPIGGLWEENEIIFHLRANGLNSGEEQNEILSILFD